MTEQVQAQTDEINPDHENTDPTAGDNGSSETAVGESVAASAEAAEVHDPRVLASEVFLRDPALRAEDFAKGYVSGELPTKVVDDAWGEMSRGKPGFMTFHKVAEADVVEALGPEGLDAFVDGKFKAPADKGENPTGTDSEAESAELSKKREIAAKLDALIDPDKKLAQLEVDYKQEANAKAVERLYKDDLADVEFAGTGLEKLSQVVDFRDTVDVPGVGEVEVGNVRVSDYSETEIPKETLAKLWKALHYVSRRSGGELYKASDGGTFDNIVIVPHDHPSLKVMIKDANGKPTEATRRGYMGTHTLVFSELALLPPDHPLQPPPTAAGEAFWHSYLKSGEETEGDNVPLRTMAKKYGIEATMVHELTHMAFYGKKFPKAEEPTLRARTVYSRVNTDEWFAERAAAEYFNEPDLVPEEKPGQLAQFNSNWKYLREKSVADGLPQGEHTIMARIRALTRAGVPRRLKNPGKPLPVELTYRLVPKPAENQEAVAA